MSPTEQQVRVGAKLLGIDIFENAGDVWLEAQGAVHNGATIPSIRCFSWAHALATLQEPGAIAHLKEPAYFGHLY